MSVREINSRFESFRVWYLTGSKTYQDISMSDIHGSFEEKRFYVFNHRKYKKVIFVFTMTICPAPYQYISLAGADIQKKFPRTGNPFKYKFFKPHSFLLPFHRPPKNPNSPNPLIILLLLVVAVVL